MPGTRNPLLKILLLPFSLIYGLVVLVRNFCFDTGIFTSQQFPLPVIGVGNITVGGTGKTPHVEYIVNLLKDHTALAVLSRGYRRKTSGFIVASTVSGVEDVGDEPLQIKKKFPGVEVAVDASRARGIRNICRVSNKLQAVVLDDAFQHRWVKPGISILLTDYNRPLKDDLLLPAGRLRERVSAKKRAEIVIVTKCPPDIKPIERRIIKKDLNLFPWQSLYFSTFVYGRPLPVFAGSPPFPEREELKGVKCKILMVTGIVAPRPLKKHLRSISPGIEQVTFPDHHSFRGRDIKRIARVWQEIRNDRKFIMTTEKDAMRFQKFTNMDPGIRENMYYIPITVSFIDNDGEVFNNQIITYVRKNKRDHILC